MDFGNFKPADWLMVAAGAVMLIFGLALDWRTLGSASADGPFDFFFTGGISWLLVSAVGVLAFLVAGKVLKPDVAPWNLIFIAATGLSTLLMLIRVLMGGGSDRIFGESISYGRGTGMIIAFVAAAVALGGALWKFVESGGTLKDLTDTNKLKSSFSKSD